MELEQGNLIDDEFSEIEMKVLYHFCDNGNRRASYRKFIKDKATDYAIYSWWKKKSVQNKVIEIGQSLAVYDTVADKVLLGIISNQQSRDCDKISAIKTWNDLRKRTTTQIKLDQTLAIDFSNVSDENLESIVNKILLVENGEDK